MPWPTNSILLYTASKLNKFYLLSNLLYVLVLYGYGVRRHSSGTTGAGSGAADFGAMQSERSVLLSI